MPDHLKRQAHRAIRIFGEAIHRLPGAIKGARHPRYAALVSLLCLCLVIDVSGGAAAEPVGYCLQIGAYRERPHAEEAVTTLKKLGKNTFYRQDKTDDKGVLYKVFIKGFESKGEARKEAKRLIEQQVITNYLIKTLDEKKGPPSAEKNEGAEGRLEDPEESGTESGVSGEAKNRPPIWKQEQKRGEESPLAIEDITFAIEKGVEEKVLIYANRYFRPLVLFALQEDRPRIAVEIRDTAAFPKGFSTIPLEGAWIKQVSLQHRPDGKTLQVILDLEASEGYDVTQVFNEAENVYAIAVIKKGGPRGPEASNPESP